MQALLYADVLCGAILNGLLVKLFWLKRKNVDQLELILAIISSDAKLILFKRYFELYKHLFWRYSKMYGKNASLHHGSFKICLRIILVLDRCEWTVKHITLSPSLDKGSCFTWRFHDQFSLFTSKKTLTYIKIFQILSAACISQIEPFEQNIASALFCHRHQVPLK